MQTQVAMKDTIRDSYLSLILLLLGAVATTSATVIAWPAISYVGDKLFR